MLVKGYRSTKSPFIVRWCLSNVFEFKHGMKLLLQLMQEDAGFIEPPTVNGYPISFSQTLRPGGTCRAFGATYCGESVVAKLYVDAASATDNAFRTTRAAAIVSNAARSSQIPLAQVPSVVASEGSWSLITPKGTPLSSQTVSKMHIDQLVHTLKVIHSAGIVHRNVCASIIFVLSDNQVLLNDWRSSVLTTKNCLYWGTPTSYPPGNSLG